MKPFAHKSNSCFAIKFPYNLETEAYIKKFHGWYIGQKHIVHFIYYNEVKLEDFKDYLKQGGLYLLDDQNIDIIPQFIKGVKIELAPLNQEKTIVYRHFLEFLKGKGLVIVLLTHIGVLFLIFCDSRVKNL